MVKKETTFSLKDQLFNKERVSYFFDLFLVARKDFDRNGYIEDVCKKFPELGLKQRIFHMTEQLYKYLPSRYEEALKIILKALHPELDPSKNDNDFGEFIISPMASYVHTYGCTEEHFDISRHALKELTKRFSVEFSIRKFINIFSKKMFEECKVLALSDNYHQRRLVSEGSRITLPRAENISWKPEQAIILLELLYADNTRYVTRSVANNMNGLSKIDPDLVLATLNRWKKSGKQNEKEMHYIIKHSLRTLLKQGNSKAMGMLGYKFLDHIMASILTFTDVVHVGEHLSFSLELSCNTGVIGKYKIDYSLGFMKVNGKISEKVFSIATGSHEKKTISFEKKHSFKLMTTRTYYEGEHTITPIVNGKRYETKKFILRF